MSEKFKLVHDGWLVVADGEKALFLRNEGDRQYPNLEVFREESQENPPNREQAASQRGRLSDGPSAHRSAVEETDWHRLGKERFAANLAEILYRYAHQGKFDDLLIAAPPLVLGELRKELHQVVLDKLVGDSDKTLTNHPIDEIEKILLA